ncbi:uncharacterized protein LOC118565668 [Fundulus heteroclitus]|uniref:uncharacterized protein LOC118565668 n=1 Tax=Fundulus heteroclitus TaxID=8078 RepID=UPI00165C0E8C|nr:uncharacterized protein LOC118565668 [Fundulus heteroclitus]XP_036002206.1 uncharacterized protein LOC118565668 [Fundulus heteroclitus]
MSKNRLHIEKAEWTFQNQLLADKEIINPNYTDRIYFSRENLTLCINELTEEDSGLYKFSYYSPSLSQISRTHKVIVQERVPRPVMTFMSENHYNLSEGLCNFTVNCSIQDDWLCSFCDKDVCRTSQRSFSKLNITILTVGTAVVCSGNNHVSTNNVSESIATVCFQKSNLKLKEESQQAPNVTDTNMMMIIIITIFVCLILLLSGAVILAKNLYPYNQNQEPTPAAQLIQSGPLDTEQPSKPRVSTTSSTASYENVEINPSQESSIPRDVFGDDPKVDTVYSIPRKAASCANSDSRKGALGEGNSQKALTSETLSGNKEESLTETDTVYSLVQMPKKGLNSQHHQEGKHE